MREQSFVRGDHHHGGDFLTRLAGGLAQAMDHAFDADDFARRRGLMQGLDPRVKIIGILALIVVVILVKSLLVLATLFMIAVGLALTSHVTLSRLFKQIWLGVFLFTGLIALPAMFLVPGEVLVRVPVLHWWITLQGVRSATFLLGRSETAATFGLLLILSTPWPHLLKALRACRVPVVLVVILGMTHRYIFILLQTATQMMEARRSRVIGPMTPRDRRRLAAGSAGVLLGKALDLSADVHLAMIARGYRGEVYLMDEFHMKLMDWVALAGFASIAALALWLQG